MSDAIADKIAKLLAKAESTTPQEAEALTEAAERLMVKYSIDQAMIDARRVASGGKPEEIVTRSITVSGSYEKPLISMFGSVARALGNVRCYISKWGKSTTFYVVGFESDAEQAITLLNSLNIQSAVAMRSWWQTRGAEMKRWGASGSEQWNERRTFIVGFGSGASTRIRKAREVAMAHVKAEEPTSGTGMELVLASRKDAVDKWLDSHVALGKGRSWGSTGSSAARGAGHAAGLNANTGDKAVGARKQIGG